MPIRIPDSLPAHATLESENIFVMDVGRVLEIDSAGARFAGTVPSGIVMVDGSGVGDVGNVVLSDRRHLSQDGLIVVSVAIDFDIRDMVSGPEVVSRGFVYEKDSSELIDSIKEVVRGSVYDALDHKNCDFPQIRGKIKDDLSKFIYQHTKRRPMILPIVLDM